MKHAETSPTCPICSATMEEARRGRIAVDLACLNCGFETDIDILQAIKEEAIINGDFDNEELC